VKEIREWFSLFLAALALLFGGAFVALASMVEP
jgi:hypothetical protein